MNSHDKNTFYKSIIGCFSIGDKNKLDFNTFPLIKRIAAHTSAEHTYNSNSNLLGY